MRRTILLFSILWLSLVPLFAWPQEQEPLGTLAKQLRAEQKDTKKATKVFTNDNLPEARPGEAVTVLPAPAGSAAKTPQTSSKPVTPPSSPEASSNPPESKGPEGEGKNNGRDAWQAKFKAARRDLANAKKMQGLAEDELNLLQIQQVREIDPAAKADLTAKVEAKQSEVDVDRATTEASQKNLDELEKEFRESGAPEEWSQTD